MNKQENKVMTVKSCCCCCAVTEVVSDSATTLILAHQTPLSLGFLRQEYLSGLPLPSPEDLPKPGIELRSPTL